MHVEDLARLTGAANASELSADILRLEPTGYSIDSRTIRPNEVFFAVRGDSFTSGAQPPRDGHDFVKSAFAKGACAAVVARSLPELSHAERARCLFVANPLVALQEAARALLRAWGRPVVGVTGSMGKTTAKELTHLTLSACGRVYATFGNLNNTYGLPLAVLKMVSDGHRMEDFDYAVLEMGMSHAGEIARQCEIAPPHVAVVLNVAPVHLENFESIEGIAEAKAEIVHGLRRGGLAVLNVDDPRVARMAAICIAKRDDHSGSQVVYFGRNDAAHVAAGDVVDHGLFGTEFTLVTLKGDARVRLPLAGAHFISNALAAAAVALHFGATPAAVAERLAHAAPAPHRGVVHRFADGFTVIDDTYNSNPQALIDASRLLARVSNAPRRILAAGEMLELGPESERMHFDAGAKIAAQGVDLLVGVRGHARELARGARAGGLAEEAVHFLEDAKTAAAWLVERVRPGDVILVKGSRGVRMEKIVEAIQSRFTPADPASEKRNDGRASGAEKG
jgi:UDP-N-acetylmuramoyl-tripeptide--D-alanyl-D-alanine ligase